MTTLISDDGAKLPNRPLTNFEIIASVKKLHIPSFRGVFTRDNLPSKPNKNQCGILNLDNFQGKGTHWTTWYRKKTTLTTISIALESSHRENWKDA